MQESPCVALVATKGNRPRSPSEELGLLPAHGSWSPGRIEPILKLGAGRAAEARLIRAFDQQGEERLCVEKVFQPGWLTRTVYRCAFQAPFAYQHSLDAVLACFYRRRVAARLVEVLIPETAVAEPLYVRWDNQSRTYVLGCRLIQGRGIRPAPTDAGMIRRAVRCAMKLPAGDAGPPAEEIDQLLKVMDRLESLFHESGLVGSGWQVSKSALVSTANLLKTSSGYVLVDLESGIPAILVLRYLQAGWRMNALPLFDDIEPRTVRQFIETHWPMLRQKLGREGFRELSVDVELLIQHTKQWKQAEIALWRRGLTVFSHAFQQAYRDGCISRWRRNELIDEQTELDLRSGPRLWSRPYYWLGLIPCGVGRFLQGLNGNRHFRRRVRRAVFHRSVRRKLITEYCGAKTAQWQVAGRIPGTRSFSGLSLRFVANCLMSHLTPAGLQRLLADSKQRRTHLERMLLLSVSGRFQRAYGKHAIRTAIRDWADAGRLYPGEYEALQRVSASQEIDEYARCFGMHLSLKFITPVLLPLKIGGAAAFLATGDAKFLLPLLVAPALRTAITLWRMIRNGWRGVKYGEALLVGMLPIFGNLAYPVQMYASHRRLATFLIRDGAARLARWLPIYGGHNSRLEIAAVKIANLPLELLEAGLKITAKIRSLLPRRKIAGKAKQPLGTASTIAWDRFVERHIQLLNDAESNRQAVPEQIDELLKRQQRLKSAA